MTPGPRADRAKQLTSASEWLDAALGADAMPQLLVAIGAAEGHLLDVLERRSPDTRVLVLEPNRDTANAFLKRRECQTWRESGRLVYLVGPDYAGADQAWRVFPGAHDACLVIVHPSLTQDRDGAVRAMQVFKRIQFGVKANADARRRFAPRYLTNVIRNVPAIVAGRDVRALADVFHGVPAVIAAAGPSLDAAIDDLHFVRGRSVLIAVDTALRPLLHAGLTPQLVVGADPGAANARHFHALPECPDTWLVSESALDRSATSLFGDRTFWFRLAKHHPWPWLNEIGVDIGHVEMWGSVLTAAFQVACLAGCDPIVMVGADLAYTDGRPYCRGTTYEFDWARETARGRSLDEVWAAQISRNKPIQVLDVRGRETVTTASLQSFRDWMVAAAARSGRRVINATGAGTLFGDRIEQSSLHAALPNDQAIASLDAIARASASPIDPRDMARRVRAVRESLTSEGSASAPIANWAAFLQDGYDPSALASALEAAASEADGAEPSRRAETIDWSRPTGRAILTQAPEALAGFRATLGATEPRAAELFSDAEGGHERRADRSAVIADSFELLYRICGEIRRLDRLPLAVKPAQIGRTPISALFTWPDDATRWPVELFEAMLHGIWPPSQKRQSTFLTRSVRLRDAAATADERRVKPGPHDHAMYACALLVLEWLHCAHESPSDVAGVMTPLVQSIAAMTSAARAETSLERATLVFSLQVATSSHSIELAVPIAGAAFARHLTGVFAEPDRASQELVCLHTDVFRASIVVRPECQSSPAVLRTRPLRIVPRVLTDDGVPGALVNYRNADGVVCVLFQRNESLVIRSDGSLRPHHQWPRPIVGELPLGDTGAVAWGDGLSGYPARVDCGYVMYRHDRDAAIVIQDLPVRPTIGQWWQGRLYWNCHPRRVESPTGLVSWAPGDETPRMELPDLPATLGLHSHEEGLTFELGGGPLPGGRWQRRFLRQGWTWRPGTALQPIQLGPYGVASSRDVSGMWTATAYPEADLVRLESSDGRALSMTCYHPIRLGWLGDSLLVDTIDQELLLFEHLSTRLGEMRG